MLYILILAGLVITGFFVLRRQQHGPTVANDMADAPVGVRRAAKRQGLCAQPNTPITASLPTCEICIGALAYAYAQMDDNQTAEPPDLHAPLTKHLRIDAPTADDLATLGPWIVDRAGGPKAAFDALTVRLKQLDHGPYFGRLMSILGDVGAAGSGGMPSARQADALGALARIFRTA